MFGIRAARVVLPALLVLAPATLLAQVKVAIINLQKAVLDTAEIQKAQKELEARYKPRQDKAEVLQKELQGIQNQLQTLAGKLTPQAEQEYNLQGQRKQRELQRVTEDLQADVDRDRQEILSRSGTRMTEIVKKISEAKTLDVVVDVSNTIYFKPALDITAEATAEYNKAYPAK
ncbi:MAG: OmpH family outer membrane protein [Acidobacteria bacterium]|nr:OmpH family outer membrane protein [Acidobacteriota bacterium]